MFPLIAASSGEPIVAGLSLILFLAVSALTIVWLIFPFLVLGKFNTLIREQRITNELLRWMGKGVAELTNKTAGDTPAATPTKPPALAPPLPKTEPEVYRI